jgi:hypothetical protein
MPQNRDNFSIGPEQSMSTVAALSWSPPGLAKHSRCLLAVLTSNLVLSLFESTGSQGKWTRIAIVNSAMGNHFAQSVSDVGLRFRKEKIRSFSWCPAIWSPTMVVDVPPGVVPPPVHPWGHHLLAVANDDNDLVLLLIKRKRGNLVIDKPHTIDVLSTVPLRNTDANYPTVQSRTLFSTALRRSSRVSHIACGPWILQSSQNPDDTILSKAVVGLVLGSELKIIGLDATITSGRHYQLDLASPVELRSQEEILPTSDWALETVHFTGPIGWIFQVG